MNTLEIMVNGLGAGMEEALQMTEKAGMEEGLGKKDLPRLRLLAEELFGMIHSTAGDFKAIYKLEYENRKFILHLQTDIPDDVIVREQLRSAAINNTSHVKSFLMKVRNMIIAVLEAENPEFSVGLMSMGSPNGYRIGSAAYSWSLNKYKSEIENNRSRDMETGAAWDELEKSIVANLADEVHVDISGLHAEVSIWKSF